MIEKNVSIYDRNRAIVQVAIEDDRERRKNAEFDSIARTMYDRWVGNIW